MDLEYDYLFKILLIGDSNVGKTSILLRYVDNKFSGEFQATIGVDFKVVTKTINEKVVKLQLWDTAGQDRFKNIVSSYYRGSQGIFIVFDVTNRVSFANVSKWYSETNNFLPESTVKILIGNKSDLGKPFRVVSEEEAKELARSLGVEYLETSAKNSMNITNIFDIMGGSILSRSAVVPGFSGVPSKVPKGKQVNKGGCCN